MDFPQRIQGSITKGVEVDLAAIDPAMALWDPLDRLYMQGERQRLGNKVPGASIWPWESDSPEIRVAWEQLTQPGNLTVLEMWEREAATADGLFLGWTAMAIETCRLRRAECGDANSIANWTAQAIVVCRQKYPGHAFGSVTSQESELGTAPDTAT